MDLAEQFAEWARDEGWKVEMAGEPRRLPQAVQKRYASVSENYLQFFACFDALGNAEDTCWFLTRDDFEPDGDLEFPADVWEQMSLEAAGDDRELKKEITTFWDVHLPIVFSLKGEYGYYAIDLMDDCVVAGSEPEFEEVKVVASTFEKFLQKIMDLKIDL